MERLVETEKVTMTLGGRAIDVTKGIDRLYALVEKQESEPGKKQTIDCPICGVEASMTYLGYDSSYFILTNIIHSPVKHSIRTRH